MRFSVPRTCQRDRLSEDNGGWLAQRGLDLDPVRHDTILWYARDKKQMKYRQLYLEKSVGGAGSSLYTQAELADGSTRPSLLTRRPAGPSPSGREPSASAT